MRSTALPLALVLLHLASAASAPCGPGPVHGAAASAASEMGSPWAGGRGILFDFDIISDMSSYEANVSDPSKPSTAFAVTVLNNGTSPGSMRLSASINLGGRVELSPTRTGVMLPKESVGVAVTVHLPETTPSALVATLRIDGQCEQSPAVTDFLQLSITVRQWHGVRLDNLTLSSESPVEREVLQLTLHVRNTGNGASYFAASARIDGLPITLLVGGESLDSNATVLLNAGDFMVLTVRWRATYGHHNFLIEAWDTGPAGQGNASSVLVKDSRVVHVFVGWSYKEWVPYILAAALGLAFSGALIYKYRRRIGASLAARRWRRGGASKGTGGTARRIGLVGSRGPEVRPGQTAAAKPKQPTSRRYRGLEMDARRAELRTAPSRRRSKT